LLPNENIPGAGGDHTKVYDGKYLCWIGAKPRIDHRQLKWECCACAACSSERIDCSDPSDKAGLSQAVFTNLIADGAGKWAGSAFTNTGNNPGSI
jgi:hypothetical protein